MLDPFKNEFVSFQVLFAPFFEDFKALRKHYINFSYLVEVLKATLAIEK